MKALLSTLLLLLIANAACDMRSGIAKKEMEDFNGPPRPVISPTPTETPFNIEDIVEVDVSKQGDLITINDDKADLVKTCSEYNRVMVNGDKSKITVDGPCKQIIVNGDGNEITADAASEIVFNGSENLVKYFRFVNRLRPSVIENRPGNAVQKLSAGQKFGREFRR